VVFTAGFFADLVALVAGFFADFAVRLTEADFDLFSDFFLLVAISFVC